MAGIGPGLARDAPEAAGKPGPGRRREGRGAAICAEAIAKREPVPGAVLGGLVLGIAETLGAGYISSAYEDVFAFGLLVLILILRPAGLLGKAVKQKV